MERTNQNDVTTQIAYYPMVLLVIVNWNGKQDLLECLTSIYKLQYPRDNYKVLVVDNASRDGSQEAVSRYYPEVCILKNKENLGYVKAVNQGITYGLHKDMDYIWIFNNDVVVEENSLKRLVEVGQYDKNNGIIAPVIYSYSNPERIDNIGYKINYWTGRLKKMKYGRDVFCNTKEEIASVDSILGCSNLVKTSVFKKIGMYQTIYELYFEETDFNVRAKKTNFRVVVVKGARVWHKNASTMNKFIFRRAYLLLRNLFLFELFNARFIHLLVFIPYFFIVHIPYFFLRGSIYGLTVTLMERRKRRSSSVVPVLQGKTSEMDTSKYKENNV